MHHEGMPRCVISGLRGHAKDIGSRHKAILLAGNERGHNEPCEDLTYLSRGEVTQQG